MAPTDSDRPGLRQVKFDSTWTQAGSIRLDLGTGALDTNQVAMKMTKEEKDKEHGEQSSQQKIQDPTKDLKDPTRGDGHKPEYQLFFLLVFLRDRICCK